MSLFIPLSLLKSRSNQKPSPSSPLSFFASKLLPLGFLFYYFSDLLLSIFSHSGTFSADLSDIYKYSSRAAAMDRMVW